MQIGYCKQTDYQRLIEIWEASVRATHDFLPEADIKRLKPLILEHYFAAVDLRVAKDEAGKILGFCGVHQGNIEMLFIEPESTGMGIGSALLKYALAHQGAHKVDVNEQNPRACGFYEHMGFQVTGRSELDGEGKPYPLLHMQLIPA